jgi:hypothetical protein
LLIIGYRRKNKEEEEYWSFNWKDLLNWLK